MSRSLILLIAILSSAGCIPHVSYDYDLQEEASLLSRVLGNVPETSIDILALSPEIVLTRFELASRDGDLSGTARIGIDGAKAKNMPVSLMMMSAIEADASIFIPGRMFHHLIEAYLMSASGNSGPIPPNQTREDLKVQAALSRSQLIDPILEAGFLVWENGGYRIRARFRDGELLLNGRPVGPDGIMTPPAMAASSASTALVFPR